MHINTLSTPTNCTQFSWIDDNALSKHKLHEWKRVCCAMWRFSARILFVRWNQQFEKHQSNIWIFRLIWYESLFWTAVNTADTIFRFLKNKLRSSRVKSIKNNFVCSFAYNSVDLKSISKRNSTEFFLIDIFVDLLCVHNRCALGCHYSIVKTSNYYILCYYGPIKILLPHFGAKGCVFAKGV